MIVGKTNEFQLALQLLNHGRCRAILQVIKSGHMRNREGLLELDVELAAQYDLIQ